MLNFDDPEMDKILLPYYNGSYKENQAGYMREIYKTYVKSINNKSLLNFLKDRLSDEFTTTIIRLFIKDLIEVILSGIKKDFVNYALVIDNETPKPYNGDMTVSVDPLSNFVKNNSDEFSKLLSVLGIENTLAIVYVLQKLNKTNHPQRL